MTIEPELTEEQLRIWIEERCGFKPVGGIKAGLWDIPELPMREYWIGVQNGEQKKVPDYTRDLNDTPINNRKTADHAEVQRLQVRASSGNPEAVSGPS